MIEGWLVWITSFFLFDLSYETSLLKTWSWYKNPLKNVSWKGWNWYFPKDAHQKSESVSVRSDLKKLYYFPLETSKNNLIRNFLRTGRVRVKCQLIRLIRTVYFDSYREIGHYFIVDIEWSAAKFSNYSYP